MKKIVILVNILLFITIFNTSFAANKLLEYGFEDWGGTVDTTPSYIFGSTYSSYCDIHKAGTEVVTSYNGLSPYSGSYFFLQNHSDYDLDPAVEGITAGAINPYDNLGLGDGVYCSNNSWVRPLHPTQLYITFRFAAGGWENVTSAGSKLKLVRYYDINEGEPILMVTVQGAEPHNPQWVILNGSSYNWGPTQSDLFDGNWHKIAFYIDYANDHGYIWCDVENPTLTNYTYYASDSYDAGDLDSLVLIDNWSAFNPTGPVWHAVDDIEVWDGMPTQPNPPSNLEIKQITP